MNSIQGKSIVDSIDSIKFIGLGHKGIEIANQISQKKKDYMTFATVDIKGVNNNPNINEHINYANDIYEWCWWCKCDFFELIDTIDKKESILKDLIKDDKLTIVVCDDSDLVSLQSLLLLGKIAKQNNSFVLPIISQTDKKSYIKEADSKYFIKKINKSVGPVIKLSRGTSINKSQEYEIIESIIDMFIENIITPCSCNLDYEDIKWLYEDSTNGMQICITNVEDKDSEEQIREKITSSIVSKARYKNCKKIIINAKAPVEAMNYNQAFKMIQNVAKSLQDISHEDCRITFSLRFEEKDNDSLDILTIQV